MILTLLIIIGILILIIIWLVYLYFNMKKQRASWIQMYLREKLKNERYG